MRKALWMQSVNVVLMAAVGLSALWASNGQSYLLPDAWENQYKGIGLVVRFCATAFILLSYLICLSAVTSQNRKKGFLPMSKERIAGLTGRNLTETEEKICQVLRQWMKEVGCESLYDRCVFRVRPMAFMPHSPLGIGLYTIPAVLNIREDVLSLPQQDWLAGIAHEFGHLHLPFRMKSAIVLCVPLFMLLALLEMGPAALPVFCLVSVINIGLKWWVNKTHEHLADAFAAQLMGKTLAIHMLVVLTEMVSTKETRAARRTAAAFALVSLLMMGGGLFLCSGCLQAPAAFLALTFMEDLVPKHPGLTRRISFLHQHFTNGVSHE